MTNARGIDVSAYQPILTPADLAGLGFCFAKATNGLEEIDPHFAANLFAIGQAGLVRGTYHELTDDDSASAQADFFMDTCRSHGIRPQDMLAVVVSDYPVTGEMADTFCGRVRELAPHNPVIVYCDLAVSQEMTAVSRWPLWVAAWGAVPPGDVRPWDRWAFWQYQGLVAPDQDEFNGTAAELRAWIASYQPKPPPPPPPPVLEDAMPLMLDSTQGPYPLTVPFGTSQIRFLCTATEKVPLKATVTFLDEGGHPTVETLDWGTGDKTFKIRPHHDEAELEVIAGAGPWIAVNFDPEAAREVKYPLPGDYGVVALHGGNLIDRVAEWAISFGCDSPYVHSFLYCGNAQIVEAVRHVQVSPADTYPGTVWCSGRLPARLVPSDGERETIVAAARSWVGRSYNLLDIAAIALAQKRLGAEVDSDDWIARRLNDDGRLICSQLVSAAYTKAGIELCPDKLAALVSPADLYNILLP